MLNSRDISLLRADVAANCRKLIALAKAEGYAVLVTGTVRDDAYQLYCVANGYASKNATRPTFHSVKAGLAFDICQNIKGREYDDSAFWAAVSTIAKRIGFSWGYDWTSFKEKCHFQWDAHKAYTGCMILAGKYPPDMPIYEEDEDMTDEKFAELYGKLDPLLATINDVPDSLKPEVQKLLDSGAINGGTAASVNAKDINMRLETLKAIIVAKR